jgi:threonyl-tRNA synthetase
MKFNLTYVDHDGNKKTPVVLHRAVFGSIDRFIAYYLEETKGALPTWLSPVEVNILPVNNEYHLAYAEEIYNLLNEENIRVELDKREEKVGYRMRESVIRKIPFTLILGQKEVDNRTISYRMYGSEDTTTVAIDEFVNLIKEKIKNKE